MGFRHIAAALLFAVLSSVAFGQTATKPPLELHLSGKEDPETVERVLKQGAKTGMPMMVRITPPSTEQAETAAEAAGLMEMANKGTDLGFRSLGTLTNVPQMLHNFMAQNADQLTASAWMTALAIMVFAAIIAAMIWRGIRAFLPDTSLEDPQQEEMPIGRRIKISLRRAVADVVAIFLFMKICHVLAFLLLSAEHPLIVDLMRRIDLRIAHFLFYVAGARAFLAPFSSGHRLVPLPNAERYKSRLIIYGLIGPLALTLTDVMRWAKTERFELAGWFLLTSICIASYKIWFFLSARHDIAELIRSGRPEGQPLSAARRIAALMAAPIYAGMAVLIWLIGRVAAVAPNGENWGNAAAATQFYVVLTPLLVTGVAQLVRSLLDRSAEDVAASPMHHAIRETASAAAASAVWLLAVADLGRVWAHFLNAVVGTAGVNLLHGIVMAAVTATFGLLTWIFLINLFNGYQPQKAQSGSMEELAEEGEAPIQSRLASVLPVLRGLVLSLVVAITALVVLNRLGIETGPLLAGFGILGLALSFGSQALVRDVISGAFFLADDAFRVGEYIDTGKLKGTVERITLRAVQLRHQTGLVHTIPYGQLQAVTNASRDWAMMRFTIRLDRSADLEQARKVIKKIGQELLTHEDFGADFIQPVKLQGIMEIQDNALIARVKFTATPFRATQIQREALKRIYLGLTAAGVPLATSDVRVRSGPPEAGAAVAAIQNSAPLPSTAT